MASDRDYLDKVLGKMFPLEITARAMFGEYGLYYQGTFFAFVCDNTLFVKVTEPGEQIAARVRRGQPYPGAKPAYKISAARLNDHDWLVDLVVTTCASLSSAKHRR